MTLTFKFVGLSLLFLTSQGMGRVRVRIRQAAVQTSSHGHVLSPLTSVRRRWHLMQVRAGLGNGLQLVRLHTGAVVGTVVATNVGALASN